MANAVFIVKAESGYDDALDERYHYPQTYHSRVQQAVGDFIVFYEPRRNGGSLSYVACARVSRIEPDPRKSGFYYAIVEEYIDFPNRVPLKIGDEFLEKSLQSDGRTGVSGNARSAVRIISRDEFQLIVSIGMSGATETDATEALITQDVPAGFSEPDSPFDFERERGIQLVSRPVRDAAFAKAVKQAYIDRCAITGLFMKNGGGRTEVDAAHIKPVGNGHRGPDSVRNGLALSKTVHWMFDRGLISVDSDFRILTAKNLVPEPIGRLIHPSGYLIVPESERQWPQRRFLEYHRDKIFKDSRN